MLVCRSLQGQDLRTILSELGESSCRSCVKCVPLLQPTLGSLRVLVPDLTVEDGLELMVDFESDDEGYSCGFFRLDNEWEHDDGLTLPGPLASLHARTFLVHLGEMTQEAAMTFSFKEAVLMDLAGEPVPLDLLLRLTANVWFQRCVSEFHANLLLSIAAVSSLHTNTEIGRASC